MGTASRVDNNQPEIVRDLRRMGCTVCHLHEVGGGCPDLLIGYNGKNYLIEIKTITGQLNQNQIDFHRLWKGEVHTVKSSREALRAIGILSS